MNLLNLEKSYNKIDFINYLNDTLLPDFKLEERAIGLDNSSLFIQMNHLGTSTDSEISVFEAICAGKDSGKRIAITQNAFRVLRQHGISNALVAFSYGTKQWRLSLLTSKLEYKDGKIISKQSNPRRYSYLLGEGAKTHTPFKYLIERGRVSSLEDLMQRFSVEVVNKQFYDEIAKHFTELVGGERNRQKYDGLLNIYSIVKPSVKYQEFAVRLIGRIMFCWFLKEKKSAVGMPLVPEKMLSQNAVLENHNYYHTVLEPLFFELLNTRHKRRKNIFKDGKYAQIPYLNGGLFNPQVSDYYKFSTVTNGGELGIVTIPDDWFKSLFGVLENYSFTVDENTTYDVELSIDPEMLGRIFENLLAEINPETGESAKKSTGSFYTPRDIVDYMVDTSLFHYLQDKTKIVGDKLCALISYGKEEDDDFQLTANENGKIVDALSTLTIIDPACGSGAFPIGILQKIVYILQQVDPNAKLWAAKQYSSVTSAELKQEIKQKEERGLFDYIRKLGVIRESIFGVDIQTIATEIAKLRCFLSLIVEETVEDDEPNRGIQPLPNLDFKFITANSLVKLENTEEQRGQISLFEDNAHINELKRIRDEYFTADPDERIELRQEFDRIQKEMLMTTIQNYAKTASNRYTLLSSWNPFENNSTTWFEPEWMFGIQQFDIVIANPPYIHLEHIKEQSRLYKNLNFSTYAARGDIYALFYERGVHLLRENGLLCYITSNKWMRAAYGESLRQFFAKRTNPIQLIDFAGQQIFDATVDTNILLLSKSKNQLETNAVSIKDKDSINNMSVYVKQNSVQIGFGSSDSWTILSPIEQSIKRKIEAIGTPLKNWDIRINYGIKTGCNEAFIISGEKRDEILRNCKNDTERNRTAELIRPILRGRDIKRYGYEWAGLYVITAYFGIHKILQAYYPAVFEHLLQYREALENRGQCRYASSGKPNINAPYPGQHHWLELDNNPRREYLDDFSKQKIVWGNLCLRAQYALIKQDYFVNAPSPLITPATPYLLLVLNSKVADWYIRNSGVTRNGGYFEYKPMFIEQLPVPKLTDESAFDEFYKQITRRREQDEDLGEIEVAIDNLVYSLFSLNAEEIGSVENFLDT
jgi:type I restriction-modification system DNA methylase subunit